MEINKIENFKERLALIPNKKPLVSIITPCYNGEEYVHRFLDSVLNQTYGKIELIFVNDGSTDRTEEIVLSYQNKFDEKEITFKYIYQENKGQAAALNKGLKVIKGEYLIWPDSDDYLEEKSILKRVEFLEKNKGYGLVRSNGNYVLEKSGNINVIKRIYSEKNSFNTHIFNDLLFKKTSIVPISYMIRTKCLFDIYTNKTIFESRSGQNYQILLPVTSKYKCGFINENLVNILVRKESHSRYKRSFKESIERINDIEIIIKETLPFCNCNHQCYYKQISIFYSRLRLKKASVFCDKNIVEIEYNYLKEKNNVRIKDIIYYYRGKFVIFNYFMKLIVTVKKILKKIKWILY